MRVYGLMLIVLAAVGNGCIASSPAQWSRNIAAYFEYKAQLHESYDQQQAAKREMALAKSEYRMAQSACDSEVKHSVATDLQLTIANQLEISNVSLDFAELDKLKARQAQYDEEYEEQFAKWARDEALKRKAHDEREAMKKAHAGHTPETCNCAVPPPDCAQPREAKFEPTPPPVRRAVGVQEIPLTINARYAMNVDQPRILHSRTQREYIPARPAKQPCCQQCGQTACGCTEVSPLHGFAYPPLPPPDMAAQLLPPEEIR